MTDGMINFLTFHRQGITGLFFRASCILLVIFLSACDGGHEQSSSESGSIAFAITLQAQPATQQAALAKNALSASRSVKARSKESEAANSTEGSPEDSQAANSTEGSSDDCEAAGVDTVRVALYDGSGSYITDGGPWPCSDHKGSLRNVPARSDLRLVVLCEDPDENVRYRGEYSGITVEDGYTTYIDGVTAYFFIPVLSAPADGSYVAGYPVTVEWHAVTGAEEYRILVSENRDLNDPITDEITPDTRFDLPDLSESTTYYWQVHALDSSGKKGAWSESIWSFTNSGPCAVDVPDVVGMTEAQARAAIEAVDDLSVGDITHECSDTVLAGNVISQQPVAGSAPCGSSVDLVVSTGQPTVPNVVGETHGDAEKAITAAGLVVGDVTLALDDSVPAGSVISQDPGPGVAPCGSAVDFVVSDGPCKVPNVVGMPQADAEAAIKAVDDFSVGAVTYEPSDTVPTGDVIRQEPVPGPAPCGSSVDLVVSTGQPDLPDVVGMTRDDAQKAITDAGLVVGNVTLAFDDSVPAGSVISQNPDPGTVPSGSTVNLVVSDGPCVVPDVAGMTEAEAKTAIEAVGNFSVGDVTQECSDTVPAGHVVSQDPATGPVPCDSTIELVLSTGQPDVPNVVGKTRGDAEKAITDAGLVVGDVTLALDDSVPAGSVISQDPGPGAAPCGSAVDLVVSDGPCVVPDVVGMTEAQAKAAIEAVDDFLVGDVTPECSDTVSAGNVISQEPVEGPAPCGSVVDLVVSTGQPTVPDVVGMTEGDAIASIEAVANLLVGDVTPECSDTVPAGDVISQEPVEGPAPCGSSVDLVISTGQPTVPDVVGMTRGEAEKAITDAGLVVGDVTLALDDSVPAGSVISQDPGPETVPCGSEVDLVVSDGPCVVPDVVGMTEAEAKNAIEAVDDFSVGAVTPECSDTVSAGHVISQEPVEGPAPCGSALNLVVSTGQPTVPDVVGMAEGDAIAAIEAVADLLVGAVTPECSDTVPAGYVIRQEPGPGPAPCGSSVDLVISTGQPTVPDVVGMTRGEAEKAITDAGLVVGEVTLEFDDSVPAGSVISQNPGPGTVLCGSAVDLVVSDGPCVVPDVVGMTEAQAKAAIEAVDDFSVGAVTPECSDTVSAGHVIRQEPVAGPAPCGSAVNLVVSTGQPTVPDVVGMAEGDAIAAIEAVADLLVGAVTPECSDTVLAGVVIRQEPVEGPAPCGSSVDLVISTGQPTVPDVVGMTRGAAETAITDAGLVVGDVTLELDDSVPAGSVISQDPGPRIVPCGSEVDLVVSDGPCVVPKVIGMTEAEATAAINAVDDFSVGIVTYKCSDTVSAGHVISQEPVEGPAPCGSSVDLVVSTGQPEVPDVVGMSEADAIKAINDVDNLSAGIEAYECSDDVPAGHVISQNLGPGPVACYSTVELVVSTGQPEVPNVVGMSEADAIKAINDVDNLSAGIEAYECSDDVPAGHVISQNLGPGPVACYSTVELVVSTGQPEVPNVVGMSEADAIKAINDVDNLSAGIEAYECSDDVPAGHVISQNLGPGPVACYSTVELVVSTGQPEVPNVVGMSEADAIKAINDVDNLSAGIEAYECSDDVPAGHVISQNLGPGPVACYSTVELVVSTGQPEVPNVVGMSEADAIKAINDVDNLSAGIEAYECSDDVPAGHVISQNLGPGPVACYSTVELVVSTGQPEVPNVVGMSEADAIKAINDVDNLSAGIEAYECSDDVPAGHVISQNLGPGPVECYSIVDLVVSTCPCTIIVYVDGVNGATGNNGRSWGQALPTIQEAIGVANPYDEIWVKEGTYSLFEQIIVNKAVAIYGGFEGRETERNERDWEMNPTTVDGGGYVRCFNITSDVTIDGFIITKGNANGGAGIQVQNASPAIIDCIFSGNSARYGGAIRCASSSPTIANCTISGNQASYGGGIGCWSNSSPTITNCTISDNTATEGWGGGIFLSASSPEITDCTVRNNTAVQSGGVECTDGSSPTISACTIKGNQAHLGGGIRCYRGAVPAITNCIITGNTASGIGGGIVCQDYAEPFFVNCTIADNEAGSYGGGIVCHGYPSWPTITNCVLWGNMPDEVGCGTATITYCDIDQDGYDGADGNIRQAPLFVDHTNEDFHLQQYSPCIDAGDPVETLTADFITGGWDLEVDSVTAISAGDTIWITDGLNTESNEVANTTATIITLEYGFTNSYLVADGAYVCTQSSDFSSEPEPNGGRINMGAYGGTAEATRTIMVPSAPRYLEIIGRSTLVWDPNTEPGLAGYMLYGGFQSRYYTFTLDVGNQTSYTVAELEPGQTYFLAVTAYNIYGDESDYSREVVLMIQPDTSPPTVTITQPTSSETYSSESDSITLGGTASDNIGVTNVTWTNNRGGSGIASGTDSWTISNIPLQEGYNVITVTAHDAAGNTGSDTLTLTCSAGDTTPPGDVTNFSATHGDGYVALSWTNPIDDDFVGTMIRYRTDGAYPTDHTDGTLVCDQKASPGSVDSFWHAVQNDVTYYYSAFTYDEVPNYSQTAHASVSPDGTDPRLRYDSPVSEDTHHTEE